MADGQEVKPLRLWPGVIIVVIQWLARFGVPLVSPEATFFGVMAGLVGGLAVIIWWAFFSRAPRSERWGRRRLDGPRHARHIALPPRVDCHGDDGADLRRLRSSRLESRIRHLGGSQPSASSAKDTEAEWPGFRGPGRDGIIPDVRIATDWSSSPPVELWRRPIGPGWSSFAVHGDHIYTQEQRGDDEVVACYDASTGEPVWRHGDAVRFWEANAGAGPRATPTLSGGRVYTLGATGILNVLDAVDGAVVWSRDAASDTGAELPGWAYAGSPLVVGDVVIVATAGTLAAYDLDTGEPRWFGPAGGRWLQLPPSADDRQNHSSAADERSRRHQRRTG